MTQWKYQYRAFAEQEPKEVRDSLAASGMPRRDQTETDTYVVGPSNVAARVRNGQIKFRGPSSSVDALVDEVQDDRYSFPVDSNVVNEAIGAKRDLVGRRLGSVDDL